MIIKQTANNEATVSPNLHWIPIGDKPPPTGSKVLVIDEAQRIAYLRDYLPRQGWTHWFPLPTLPKGDNATNNQPSGPAV